MAGSFGIAFDFWVPVLDASILDADAETRTVNGQLQVKTEKIRTIHEGKKIKSKAKVYDSMENDGDGCMLDNCGEPGSAQRLEALREHYSKPGETSPFVWSDEEIADEVLKKFVAGDYDNDSGKHFHKTIKELCQDVLLNS